MSKYESLTIPQLKEKLKIRGFKASGKKGDLVERLISLDAMGVPDRGEKMEPEYQMSLPPPSKYTDIHSDTVVPPIRLNRVLQYFQGNGKAFTDKFKQLYEERYTSFVRMAVEDDIWYFTGSVWAEMRKTVSYKVDITMDKSQVVQAAQCECAAGQGPSAHCKHVACILYALHSFSEKGDIVTEQTCTQVLQTFHKTKPYKGSPMKASDIQDIRNHTFEYDPRPLRFRDQPGYQDRFRNTVLNFQGVGRMPVTQLYQPANPYAVNAMHDYDMSLEKTFFKLNKLNSITTEDCIEIEAATRGQAINPEWMKLRQFRITSSNFGTICKSTNRRDMGKLTDSLISPTPFTSEATRYGRAYEQVAVEQYEAEFGKTEECGLFVCQEYPWLAATPDRIVSTNILLEVKCPFSSKNKLINSKTVPYISVDGNLMKMHNYYYQIQGQLLCTQKQLCHFCVYTQKDMQVIKVDKDQQFIDDMVAKLKIFYDEHLKPALLQKHVYKSYDKYFM